MPTRILIFTLLSLLFHLGIKAEIPDSLRQEVNLLADSAAVRHLLSQSKAVMYTRPSLGEQYADLALEKAAKLPKLLPVANIQRGVISWVNSDFGEALSSFRLAIEQAERNKDSLSIAKAKNNMGMVYMDLSQYDLALDYALQALAYFESRGNDQRTATARMNVANIYNRNGNLVAAENYYKKSLEVFTAMNDTNAICMVYNNLGLLVRDQGRVTEAVQHFQTALDGYTALGYLYGQTKVLSNMASAYAHQERFAQAESLHLQSFDLALQLNNPHELAIAQYNLGELYRKSHRFGQAVEKMEASLKYIPESGDLLLEATNHHGLSDVYERLGKFEKSLFHFKLFKQLTDSIFNQSKAKSLAQMQVSYEIDLKNKEIENLEQQKSLDQLRKLGLGIALGFLLILGGLIVLRQRNLIRREKALKEKDREVHEAQTALVEADMRSSETEKRRLKEELEYKTREITNLAMNIVRRNDFLEVLDRELKALRKDGNDKKLKDLSILVSQTLSLENERQEFQIFIQEAQQNFFLKIEAQFPSLSQKEKRLCAMIKLGLSSKEIAAVFNIATSSVEVARYRLRKKLDLSTNEGLKEFLSSF